MNGKQKVAGKHTYRSTAKTSPYRYRFGLSCSKYQNRKQSSPMKLSPRQCAIKTELINVEPTSLLKDENNTDHRNSYSFSHQLSTIFKCRQSDFNSINNKGNKSFSNNQLQKQEKPSINHLSQAENGIEKALKQHREMKLRLQDLRREKQKQQEEDFKRMMFKPQIIKSERYKINANLEQRQMHIEAAHKERLAKQQQELAANQLKECTFQPALIAKEKSNRILKKKEDQINLEKEKEVANPVIMFQEVGNVISFAPKPKNTENFDYKTMKNLIHREIKRLS